MSDVDTQKRVNERLQARVAVWLAELSAYFHQWGFDWSEPYERLERAYAPTLPDEVVLSWQRHENGKHLTVILEDEDPHTLRSVTYYGYGPDGEQIDGGAEYPVLTYLLWYWLWH